jgi:hypothetical protein
LAVKPNSLVMFAATDAAGDRGPWVTDGTAAGTTINALRALRFWLAAFFVVAGSVLAASQPNSQQESKLVRTGAVKPSPSLSVDGNIAVVGGPSDNSDT